MKNTLNGSVKSGMLKAAMVLMMMSASAELAGTLNAQGKGKAQTEKTTENMTAADF